MVLSIREIYLELCLIERFFWYYYLGMCLCDIGV